MIQDSCVCVAWVERAISGIATFNEDIAAVTAASARQTTAVTAPWRTVRVSADVAVTLPVGWAFMAFLPGLCEAGGMSEGLSARLLKIRSQILDVDP
jgi:hypothetical protein